MLDFVGGLSGVGQGAHVEPYIFCYLLTTNVLFSIIQYLLCEGDLKLFKVLQPVAGYGHIV